jgi:hypothetical protein
MQDVEQVACAPGQPVEPSDHQHVVRLESADDLRQLGPVGLGNVCSCEKRACGFNSGLRVLTLSGCGAAPGPPNVKTAYSRRGGRADRARNQSELMRASRRMISGSYLLARIRTGWDFREPQVTVSQTCFRAPEICCRSDTVQQKSVSAFEPSPQSHATARGPSHFHHRSR